MRYYGLKIEITEQRRIVAYLDSVQARLVSLRQVQSATGEELRPLFGWTLLPSAEGATIGRGV